MQVYLDESKSKNYLLVAVIVEPGIAKSIRSRMLKLRMPGQKHLHFVSERDSRRKFILSEIRRMEFRARAYSAVGYSQTRGRDECLNLLLDDIETLEASIITFEKDESAENSDRLLLHRGLHSRGLARKVEYRFMPKSAEPIIWIADAIAWSYARGGDFKRRVDPLIEKEKSVVR